MKSKTTKSPKKATILSNTNIEPAVNTFTVEFYKPGIFLVKYNPPTWVTVKVRSLTKEGAILIVKKTYPSASDITIIDTK